MKKIMMIVLAAITAAAMFAGCASLAGGMGTAYDPITAARAAAFQRTAQRPWKR